MQKIIPQEAVLIPENAECAFSGVIYDVYQWPQQLYDGSVQTFEMLKRADTVTAICIVDGKIVVLNDTQPHRGERIGFPGGRVDDTDADTLEAAKREVYEETGLRFNEWRLIRVDQPFSKMEWFVYEYMAWDCSEKGTAHNEPGEKIVMQEMDFEKAKDLVLRGVGYLGSSAEFFETAHSAEDMLSIPEFSGVLVDG